MKAIGVVSDLHVGSIFGLLPPDFVTSAGALQPQNVGQKHLWECWLRLGEWFGKNKINGLVINGDVIDGDQRAQRGTELCLPILKDQVEAAHRVIGALVTKCGNIPIYVIQGTEYHDQKACTAADALAEMLGAETYYGLGTGKRSREMLDLDVEGVVINIMHHISASVGLYQATAPDREGVWSALAGKEGKANRADCLVRSHVHRFTHLEYSSKHIVVTPCFQLQTRFMRRTSAYRMIPEIGGVILCIDGEAKKAGEDPIQVKKCLFPLPSIKPVKFAA